MSMFLQENAKFLQGIQYFCGKTLKVLQVNTVKDNALLT